MINNLKSKLKELDSKKAAVKPRIEEIETKRAEELQEINKKYDHMVQDVNIEVEYFEQRILNEMVDAFVKVVMEEFDAKRSISDYMVTDKIKDFRDSAKEIEMFPNELIERLDEVIDGAPIENLAYDIEKIEKEYKSLS